MKNFIKTHMLGLVIAASILFITAFMLFLFHKVGDDVYITAINGSVSIGTTDDLHNLVMAQPGMKLAKNNIIVTGDKSSCILSYEKKASDKDNFVNIGENSQVMLYDKNSQGGYKFFVTYGSVICNMTSNKSYKTNISTKLFNLFVDGTITKIDYDNEINTGKVYTFDGNPMIQTIQPSGTTNTAEKLLKNSVCAVSSMDNGTVGFGCLNVGFELSSFTAQDLKAMSGIANIWSEKISYNTSELEQAFQTASDYAKWTATEPVILSVTTLDDANTVPLEMLTGETDEDTYVTSVNDEYYTETTIVTPDYNPDEEYYDDSSYNSSYDYNSGNAFSTYADTSISVPYTAFTRQTVSEINSNVIVTTTPVTEAITSVPETTVPNGTGRRPSTTTAPYSRDDDRSTTTKRPDTTTSSSKHDTPATAARYTTTTPRTTSPAPAVTTAPATTAPAVTVSPNTAYTVVFEYDAGVKEYWSIQVVKYGESAIAPDAPKIPGKRFVRWNKDFSRVTSDMTITAIFVDDTSTENTNTVTVAAANEYYTVKLYVESKLWKTVSVKKGETVSVSNTPVSSDTSLEFCGWSDSLTNIQSDKTVFALFRPKQS